MSKSLRRTFLIALVLTAAVSARAQEVAQPIADAVPPTPVNASFTRFNAQSAFAGVTRRSSIALAIDGAPEPRIDEDDEGTGAFEDAPSHADATHASTIMPIRIRLATGA